MADRKKAETKDSPETLPGTPEEEIPATIIPDTTLEETTGIE